MKLGSCCKKCWQKYQLHKSSVADWTSAIPILLLDMKLFHIVAVSEILIEGIKSSLHLILHLYKDMKFIVHVESLNIKPMDEF